MINYLSFSTFRHNNSANQNTQSTGEDENEFDHQDILLTTKDFDQRVFFIQKYGYSLFLPWFQETSFFNHCQINGLTNIAPLYKIRRESRKSPPPEVLEIGEDIIADDWIKFDKNSSPIKNKEAEFLVPEWEFDDNNIDVTNR